MAAAVASLVIGRAVRRSFPSAAPICRPRGIPTLTSPRFALRVLISRALVRPCPAISVRHASSSTSKAVSPEDMIIRADKNLLNVLEWSARRYDQDLWDQQFLTLPEDSPFEIVDDPGGPSFMLKREFQGEKVEVLMNLEEDDDESKNASGDAQPSVPLVVTINKGDGPDLEFCCCMDSERLEIKRMTLRRPGEVDTDGGAYGWPAFSGLNKGLQKALHNYLVVRGIKPSIYDFFRNYWFMKDDMDFDIFLKKLTEFVANGVVTREFCPMCMSKKNRPAKH